MVANFGTLATTLKKGAVIARVLPGPATVIRTQIPAAEVLGIETPSLTTPAEPDSDAISVISEDSIPEEVKALDLSHLPVAYHKAIRKMLSSHSALWSGTLGEISTATHHIELIPGA